MQRLSSKPGELHFQVYYRLALSSYNQLMGDEVSELPQWHQYDVPQNRRYALTISRLHPDADYEFKVQAANRYGRGRASDIIAQRTLGKLPYGALLSFQSIATTTACTTHAWQSARKIVIGEHA